MTPTIIYAAKSTEDVHGSIPTQIADCEAMAEREGWTIEGVYSDEAASAYKGNRGQGLADARAHAERLAAEHGSAQIIVQHSDRLARGDGVGAQHLVEIALWALKLKIRIRSWQDDGTFENLVMTAMMGERNHEDSKRKSAAVKAGKRRAAEQGRWTGGPAPAGYEAKSKARSGRVEAWLVKHPTIAPIYELLWQLAEGGHSAESIALELNRRGYRTKPVRRDSRPKAFDANAVRSTLSNPRYAGIVVHDGERLDVVGQWPAFVDPETFDRLKAERARKAHLTKRKAGRPPTGYLLQGLARCARCGGPMQVKTKHDGRGYTARTYECGAHRNYNCRDDNWCPAKAINADQTDAMVVEGLPALLADGNVLRDRLLAERKADRARLTTIARETADEVKTLEGRKTANDKHYREALSGDLDDDRLALFTDAAASVRGELRKAIARRERALEAITAADDELAADDPQVALGKLAERLTARLDDAAADAKAINTLLREWFEAFALSADDRAITARPFLASAAAESINLLSWPHGILMEADGEILPFEVRPGKENAELARLNDGVRSLGAEPKNPPALIREHLGAVAHVTGQTRGPERMAPA